MTNPQVLVNQAADPALTRFYSVTGTSGAAGIMRTVCDMGEGLDFDYLTTWQTSFGPFLQMPRSIRFRTDATKVQIALNGNTPALTHAHGFRVSVDRVPIGTFKPSATGLVLYHHLVFPDSKPRLIEVRTNSYFAAIYAAKPYDFWKPPARVGPRVLVMGDSWTSPANCTDNYMNSAYWDIGPLIGSEDVWVDHYGGTGYTVGTAGDGSGAQRYADRIENTAILTQTWNIASIAPDVFVVHGGGANDKFKSKTNQQVIDGATAVLTRIRERCPLAKIVFVEGVTPPGFVPATYNPNYIAIRQGVQANCAAVGVYYIDVATTKPWFFGAGNASTPNADNENNNLYITSDNFHKNDAGHLYLRRRMADRLNTVIKDDGTLLNQLI